MQMRAVFDYVASQAFDVVMLQAAFDRDGNLRLGPNVDFAAAAMSSARMLIGEVNEAIVATGRMSAVDRESVRCARSHAASAPAVRRRRRPTARRTGSPSTLPRSSRDGDCIQTGIGAIPAAILAALANKNDLGHALRPDRRRRHGI